MSMTPTRHRTTVLTVGVLTAALALTGCSSSDTPEAVTSSDSATHTVEADNGPVEVPVDPQRVVALGTSIPFLDMGGKPVGASTILDTTLVRLPEDQQATYAAAEHLAASTDEVDIEQVASLKPDLILVQTTEAEFKQVEDQLQAIAPTVYWPLSAEWEAQADVMASAANLTASLNDLKTAYEEKVSQITETYGDIIAGTKFVNVDRYASTDPGTFIISDIGCMKVARDNIGLSFPEAAEGADPLAWSALPFEQLTQLSDYDAIFYPVGADGKPTEAFEPVVETNTWQALPAVIAGKAFGLSCVGNNSYGHVTQYLESLDTALAALAAKEN